MKAPAFAYCAARSTAEVFELLERHGTNAKPLVGGQSLVPALNMRLAAPQVLIDINRIDGLRGIAVTGEGMAGAPGAVMNTINGALAPFDARVIARPFTPERVLRALGKV